MSITWNTIFLYGVYILALCRCISEIPVVKESRCVPKKKKKTFATNITFWILCHFVDILASHSLLVPNRYSLNCQTNIAAFVCSLQCVFWKVGPFILHFLLSLWTSDEQLKSLEANWSDSTILEVVSGGKIWERQLSCDKAVKVKLQYAPSF